MKEYVSGVIEHSGKMVILMEIIEQCILLREKILIFRLFVVVMVVCNHFSLQMSDIRLIYSTLALLTSRELNTVVL